MTFTLCSKGELRTVINGAKPPRKSRARDPISKVFLIRNRNRRTVMSAAHAAWQHSSRIKRRVTVRRKGHYVTVHDTCEQKGKLCRVQDGWSRASQKLAFFFLKSRYHYTFSCIILFHFLPLSFSFVPHCFWSWFDVRAGFEDACSGVCASRHVFPALLARESTGEYSILPESLDFLFPRKIPYSMGCSHPRISR